MDFGKAFTFAFEDEGWLRKLGIGGLIFFVGLLLLVIPGLLYLIGYQIAVGRRVYQGESRPLPEGDNFGEIMRDGLLFMAIALVYALPIIVVVLPFSIAGAIMTENGASEAIGGMLIFVGACLNIIFALGLAFFFPAVVAQFIRTGDFGACFRLGEIWSNILQPNLLNVLFLILATIAAQLIVQLVVGLSVITICGPIILAFPAAVWTSAFSGHLYGQLAAMVDGKGKAEAFEFA